MKNLIFIALIIIGTIIMIQLPLISTGHRVEVKPGEVVTIYRSVIGQEYIKLDGHFVHLSVD